jgi:hypothetical protein
MLRVDEALLAAIGDRGPTKAEASLTRRRTASDALMQKFMMEDVCGIQVTTGKSAVEGGCRYGKVQGCRDLLPPGSSWSMVEIMGGSKSFT